VASSLITALKGLLDGPPASAARADPIRDAVERHMPGADADERRLVTAIAGLLACVAFADAKYTEAEKAHVAEALGRLHGLGPEGAAAVAAILEERIGAVVASGDSRWVRDLRELTEREERVEILEVLVELAAADDELAHEEANYLRRLTTALGLEQHDYVALQAKHRHKLAVLK
jgi:uncharacterized tellurite resistance protein B-like protein